MLTAGIQYISPVTGVADELDEAGRRRGRARRQPARRPDRRVPRAAAHLRHARRERKRRSSTSGSPRSSARLSAMGRDRASEERRPTSAARSAASAASGAVTPWLLRTRACCSCSCSSSSRSTRCSGCRCRSAPSRFSDPTFNWDWANYGDAFSQFGDQFYRSFVYAAIATLLALLIGYPLAYVIAFRGGRCRNVLLGLVVVPFFTNFLIRTLAWQTILGDAGLGRRRPPRRRDPRPHRTRLLRTPHAVIGGLTYNFLPFMVLPIYVASRRSTRGSSTRRVTCTPTRGAAFRKIVFPLSLPGVFAGSLLVFIPAAGDFVNAYYLGNAQHHDDRQRRPGPVPRAGQLPRRRRALVRVHGDHHGARARLRACPRHRGPRRERRRGTVTVAPAGRDRPRSVDRTLVGRASALLYLFAADLRDRRVQLQRAEGPLQRGLAGVHARQLAAPVRRQAARRRAGR